MKHFRREDLRELIGPVAGPAVSVYLPTDRTGQTDGADRLRALSALSEARALLAARPDSGAVAEHLDAAERWVDRGGLAQQRADGLALFASATTYRHFRLPRRFEPTVMVADTFHTRPLVAYLQAPQRYWVLGLSINGAALYEGDVHGLGATDLPGAPKDLADAVGSALEPDRLSLHSNSARAAAVYHGQGAGKDDLKPELERYFRLVDSALRDRLGEDDGPVVLAAIGRYHPLFRQVTRLDTLAERGVEANVARWSEVRLAQAAWPIACEAQARRVDEALQQFEVAYGRGRAEVDPVAAFREARSSRIHKLLLAEGQLLWGTVDRATGQVSIDHEDADHAGHVELTGELAEAVLIRGGSVLVVPPDRMPAHSGIAAILR